MVLWLKIVTINYLLKDGIVRKPHEQDNMGLTANFNIEDEYVENLLKQIHFMNLEVKLL